MKIWLFAGLALCTGCLAPGSSASDDDPTQRDVDAWNQLSTQFDGRRTMFLGTDVEQLAAVGNHLFWFDTTNFDPKLDSYDDLAKARLAYTFSIGSGDLANYRASSAVVVTADPSSNPVIYRAYDASSAARPLGTTSLMKPPGAQWDAYAVDGTKAYIVDTSIAGETRLLEWQPGSEPTSLTTLESAGAQIGEFEDFGVFGNTMVFVESGRIWKLDLAANRATWLMNATEVSGKVDFRPDGVMFESASGVMFYDYAASALTNVSQAIDANSFQINTTFASASHFDTDFARWKTFVLYIGQGGLFAYDLAKDRVTPILLSPDTSDLRVDYRYPVVLDDGTAFVTGLTSTSGATGADGPTYELDLPSILL